MHNKLTAAFSLGGLVFCGLFSAAAAKNALGEEKLFVATPLTRPGEFTDGIEGPNCDAKGNIFVVNFARQGTIGLITPEGHGEVYVTLPPGSIGNGIVFDRRGNMYVADYTGHNVLIVDPATKNVRVYAHESSMTQPNDLAIAPDGTIFASDPNWKNETGRVWRVDTDGKISIAADRQGTSNGIEVSPDGKTLYVNESDQKNIFRFTITADHRLVDRKLIRRFKDHGFDGMRCDVDGNLYICRYGNGTVVKMTPAGQSPARSCHPGPAAEQPMHRRTGRPHGLRHGSRAHPARAVPH